MGIFHRSSRSTSRSTTTSTTTPRSSIDSTSHDSSLEETLKPQIAPLLSLPIELLQQVTSHLDNSSSASLCLSSRYIYYALGTQHLSTYLHAAKSRFEKRRRIEAVIERAFPGHWFCAWCDVFHAWDAETGPREASERDCAEFNSYLDAGAGKASGYAVRFHHVRLAMNRYLWGGKEHGIGLDAFTHTSASMATLYRTPVPTSLAIDAKISSSSNTLLLHATFAIILPSWSLSRKSLIHALFPLLPHILSGHRDAPNGHTGLMAAIDNVVRRGWKYGDAHGCGSCRTDWTVQGHFFPHMTGGQMRLVVQSWRDLGDGRNPFDSAWRAHGVAVKGLEGRGGVSGMKAGDGRRAFEAADSREVVVRRAVSPVRTRIYETFMRKGSGGAEVRRSSARPVGWRVSEEMDMREDWERGRM